MNYLAIDTSGKNLTIVVCKNGEIFSYFDKECGVNHSVSLMPTIEKLVLDTCFDLSCADFFACVVGAGSFTGIRIGVATTKALCLAYNKPCLSVTSFDTIAYNKENGKNLAVIDAKHNGYYACGYDGKTVILPPCYISGEKVIELSKSYNILSCDDICLDGVKVQEVSLLTGLINAVEDKKQQLIFDINSLTPLYVRKSQAEENRP